MKYVSSTEMSSVLHCNPNKSRKKLYKEKRKLIRRFHVDNEATRHGNFYEPYAIMWACNYPQFYKWSLRTNTLDSKLGIMVDNVAPLCCSPDALFLNMETREIRGLEVKCPYSREIPLVAEDVDRQYIVQALVCALCFKLREWYLLYYNANKPEKSSFWKISILDDSIFYTLKQEAEVFLNQVEQENDFAGFKHKSVTDEYFLKNFFHQIEVTRLDGGVDSSCRERKLLCSD